MFGSDVHSAPHRHQQKGMQRVCSHRLGQFQNLRQLVFGGGHDESGGSDVGTMHFPDLPLLATLLGANLRHGRNVAAFDSAVGLKVYVEQPPSLRDEVVDRLRSAAQVLT